MLSQVPPLQLKSNEHGEQVVWQSLRARVQKLCSHAIGRGFGTPISSGSEAPGVPPRRAASPSAGQLGPASGAENRTGTGWAASGRVRSRSEKPTIQDEASRMSPPLVDRHILAAPTPVGT